MPEVAPLPGVPPGFSFSSGLPSGLFLFLEELRGQSGVESPLALTCAPRAHIQSYVWTSLGGQDLVVTGECQTPKWSGPNASARKHAQKGIRSLGRDQMQEPPFTLASARLPAWFLNPACCGRLLLPRHHRGQLYLLSSLDLTSPLLLGGVPNLLEDFPVYN